MATGLWKGLVERASPRGAVRWWPLQERRKDPKVRLGDEMSGAAHCNDAQKVKALLDQGRVPWSHGCGDGLVPRNVQIC